MAWNPAEQPDSFEFDEISEKEIVKILLKYPEERKASGTLPLLYIVQEQMKRQTGHAWIPLVAMDLIAERLEVPAVRVYEVASFYTMFNTRPVGRYHLQVCTTTSCWLRGSDDVIEACKKAAGVKGFGETSEDGMFTLSQVECLGACANAPVLQVDDDYYEDMDGPRTEAVINALREGKRPAPGPSTGRESSAPEGGRKTLLKTSSPKSSGK